MFTNNNEKNVVIFFFFCCISTVASLISSPFISNRVWWRIFTRQFVFILYFVFNRLWCDPPRGTSTAKKEKKCETRSLSLFAFNLLCNILPLTDNHLTSMKLWNVYERWWVIDFYEPDLKLDFVFFRVEVGEFWN
jgi:hypothetical protein